LHAYDDHDVTIDQKRARACTLMIDHAIMIMIIII